jgi:hypothetical protein
LLVFARIGECSPNAGAETILVGLAGINAAAEDVEPTERDSMLQTKPGFVGSIPLITVCGRPTVRISEMAEPDE